ncbi:hypothetical protein [Phenylobacterium sp.]|uniref:hypothetical protein n=1 Tax=Phenylobacterium sp. TaxID=1871053 RepID=UPI0030F37544
MAALPGEVEAYELAPPEQRVAGGLGDRSLAVIAHGKPFTGPQAWMEDGWSAGQARLAALSTDSETVIATRSGHAIAQTEPDLVAQVIRRVVWRARASRREVFMRPTVARPAKPGKAVNPSAAPRVRLLPHPVTRAP